MALKIDMEAQVGAPRLVSRETTFDLDVQIQNKGAEVLCGTCRLLLNHGFQPTEDTQGWVDFEVQPESTDRVVFSITLHDSFNEKILLASAFDSVATAVEVFVGDTIFWLNAQHKGLRGNYCRKYLED